MTELQITRLSGPGQGKPRSFTNSPVSFGTAAGCDFRFDAAWDKTVSGRHAFIEWRTNEWVVRDGGSKDGTLVNGRRINQPVPVGHGLELELGSGGPRLKVSVITPPPAPVRSAAPGGGVGSTVSGTAKPPGPISASKGSADKIMARVILILLLATLGWLAWKYVGGDSDAQMAVIAKKYENAVGLVVLAGRAEPGEPPKSMPMATAWAVGENVFATNGHVTVPVAEALANGHSAFVVINKDSNLRFRVTKAVTHPRYDQPLVNVDGKEPAVSVFDVGLLYVEGKVPNKFLLASDLELEKLDSGYRVAYLGFPIEGIAGGGVDHRSPVATMQSGIITANTDYWLAKAAFKDRLLVAHNLGATGGSSGSPVFNTRGEVVGILSAGNIIGQVSIVDGEMVSQRAPSGVMINYAQRVDMLRELAPGLRPVAKTGENADSPGVVRGGAEGGSEMADGGPLPDEVLGGAVLGFLLGTGSALIFTISGVILILILAGLWKVFVKAGEEGWLALIPIANAVIFARIGGRPGWWALHPLLAVLGWVLGVLSVALVGVPVIALVLLTLGYVASAVVHVLICQGVAERFGKGIGFTIGLLLLPAIFIPILGFGKATYRSPDANKWDEFANDLTR
jgi:hypothetical protein